MLEYDVYLLGEKPKNLLVFLHGYNSTVAKHQYAIDWLRQYLANSVLIVPHAPEASDKNPERFQWFGMQKHDAANRRTLPETSCDEIFAIYAQTATDIDCRAMQINNFIDDLQQQYHIDDTHTFLCGFSQGAMLTIYASLTRNNALGGAFVLSGLVAGADTLSGKIHSRPPLYLFHGTADMRVQFKTLPVTTEWLKLHNVPLKITTYNGLEHRVIEQEIAEIADIINRRA